MTRPLRPDTLGGRHHGVAVRTTNEEHKPNLRGFKVYVGDFVGVDDPGNDPYCPSCDPPISTGPSSPPWQNGFGFDPDAPIWFAHGLDGEGDMGGQYDLVTGSPVSGDVAFTMPMEWAVTMPLASDFPVELSTDVWTIAVQTVNHLTGDVRIFWPIVAAPVP